MQREIVDCNTSASHRMLITMATRKVYTIVGQIRMTCPLLCNPSVIMLFSQSVVWCEDGCGAYEQEIFPDGNGKCIML